MIKCVNRQNNLPTHYSPYVISMTSVGGARVFVFTIRFIYLFILLWKQSHVCYFLFTMLCIVKSFRPNQNYSNVCYAIIVVLVGGLDTVKFFYCGFVTCIFLYDSYAIK